MPVSQKANQRDTPLGCELDSKARWRTDGRQDAASCSHRFLYKFEASPAAEQKRSVRQRNLPALQAMADQLVERVVTPNIFEYSFDRAVSANERRRMKTARCAESLLPLTQLCGKPIQRFR